MDCSLTLKSASPSTRPNALASQAVLCTPAQTFRLRQVHSSNSIFLIQPGQAKTAGAVTGLSIISLVKATLEVQLDPSSALPYLGDLLPCFHGVHDTGGDLSTMTAARSGIEKLSKRALFNKIPLSEEECERAWLEICAYEDQSVAWRPSSIALLDMWRAVQSAATSEGLNLSSQFLRDDIWKLVAQEGQPRPLMDAVFSRIAHHDSSTDQGCTCNDNSHQKSRAKYLPS